ncbi:YitT family protein [Bradyrhizobium sp. 5.13L]
MVNASRAETVAETEHTAGTALRSTLSHSRWEDLQALLTGSLLVALAITFFKQAGLLTGGTAGLAVIVYYLAHWPLGLLLFVINLPFYIFGWLALGRSFTIRTFAAISAVGILVECLPHVITISSINAVFAAIMAGQCAGIGILILVRHGASLGGLTILGLYLQQRRGFRAGWLQLCGDCLVLALGMLVSTPDKVALSILGAASLNAVIAINHRQGRYFGT